VAVRIGSNRVEGPSLSIQIRFLVLTKLDRGQSAATDREGKGIASERPLFLLPLPWHQLRTVGD